jgi:hypothetical protein
MVLNTLIIVLTCPSWLTPHAEAETSTRDDCTHWLYTIGFKRVASDETEEIGTATSIRIVHGWT